MAAVALKNISKSFLQRTDKGSVRIDVLRDLSFDVADGEFLAVVGPNACGKTTLLKIIAGLEQQDDGRVETDGPGDEHLRTGFVFQNYAESLYPWRTVADNITLPLELAGLGKKERRKRAVELSERLGLHPPMEAYPYQLSAGQQQQVALLRTLAYDPHVILMDEPFSSLDYQTRLLSQDQLQRIWLETRKTVFFVSHDVDEAIYLADRLILLSQRPATIREVFRIPLPRPRDHTVLEGEAFFAIRSKVLSQYQEVIRQ